jgi:phosphoribosylanthranilate isomerase
MVRVKICGITNSEDALTAVEYGADALGFVFAPSARRVDVATVIDVVGKLPPFIVKVGVFADSDLAEVRETMSICGLDMVQLHGREGPEFCAALFPRVIKAFTAADIPPPGEVAHYPAAALLLDREKGVGRDDTGDSRLWDLAREIAEHSRVILAGGLTPENVAQAIETARPYAVDVARGVESEPGRKDRGKLRDFLAAAKEVRHAAETDQRVCPDIGDSRQVVVGDVEGER